MAKRHGARQQKKAAKQKAKRLEKRSSLMRRTSTDPTVRLQRAEKWPIVGAWCGAELWKDGIGYLVLARKDAEGSVVYAVYLVDVFCLGVKDAFWRAGSMGSLHEMIERMGERQSMSPIDPACLVKIIKGAVEFAKSFGFHPHHDFRHAAMLLQGIDPAACAQEYTFGKDGKPFYFRGPNETLEQARAISERVVEAGGHYLIGGPDLGGLGIDEFDDDDFDDDDDDDDEGESGFPSLPGP